MIKYCNENIFDKFAQTENTILVHGCNCFNVMNAGFAKQLRELYPKAYEVDWQTECGAKNKLGTFSFAEYVGNRFIINAYIQYYYGQNIQKGCLVDYKALKRVLEAINENFPSETIIMPKIGSGLARGNWETIENIINKVFSNREVIVFVQE